MYNIIYGVNITHYRKMKNKTMKNKKVLLLYSGGFDSTLLLELALRMGMIPLCLLIDYEQTHIEELKFAESMCKKKGVELQKVILKGLAITSKLTTDEVKYEGVSEWYVPSRNLMFVSLAASIAESRGIELIWFGAMYDDRVNLFPDCYQEWVYKLNELLTINGSKTIKVEAPLLGFTKPVIQELAKLFNISEKEVFSGYGRE